ncbi:MAG: ABC transporter ATP-binding protein [Burkholderiales bacterium]|uniref:ABC transporter ATP-binding protein n=1 Tax=Inhella sp. TaxID=1921806 RepID=UPI001AC38013|nr:ABC transporter ATP-binding protein [Burkholderiales bacterium]
MKDEAPQSPSARDSGAPAAAPALLAAEQLTRTLPGEVPVTLVNSVSLSIGRGEFVSIVGPSGSGKSSLLYLLGLLDRPTRGRLVLDGEDTSAFSEDRLADTRLAKLGFVFQFHFLLPEFSLLDNVALPMRRLGRLKQAAVEQRALNLLEQLGLRGHERKQPHQISGGQRQRVAIARALANEPLLILADEPTGNLDSASSQNVSQILRELVDRVGTTVITVTHDHHFAAGADRVITLVDGRVALE